MKVGHGDLFWLWETWENFLEELKPESQWSVKAGADQQEGELVKQLRRIF